MLEYVRRLLLAQTRLAAQFDTAPQPEIREVKPTVGAAANADTGSINIRINCSMQRARPTTDGLPGS